MVHDASSFNTQHYKVRIKGKWNNPVAPSHTSRCSNEWKVSLQVILDYSRQLIYLIIKTILIMTTGKNS